jgi:hypothetical protein
MRLCCCPQQPAQALLLGDGATETSTGECRDGGFKQGRYDRMTDDLFKLTGQKPISMYDFVKLHAAEFTRDGTAA